MWPHLSQSLLLLPRQNFNPVPSKFSPPKAFLISSPGSSLSKSSFPSSQTPSDLTLILLFILLHAQACSFLAPPARLLPLSPQSASQPPLQQPHFQAQLIRSVSPSTSKIPTQLHCFSLSVLFSASSRLYTSASMVILVSPKLNWHIFLFFPSHVNFHTSHQGTFSCWFCSLNLFCQQSPTISP